MGAKPPSSLTAVHRAFTTQRTKHGMCGYSGNLYLLINPPFLLNHSHTKREKKVI